MFVFVCVCVFTSVSQKMYDSWSVRRSEIYENMHCVGISFLCFFTSSFVLSSEIIMWMIDWLASSHIL